MISKFMQIIVVVMVIAYASAAFYTESSGVVNLDSKNFKKEVLDSNELWMVEFYAPWCGHCQALKPTWEKVAKSFKGIVKFGAVDMDANRDVGAPYDIKGFPTIKFFGTNKIKPQSYESGRDDNSISEFVFNEIKKAVKGRQGGKSDSSSGSKKAKEGKGSSKAETDGDVIVLTDSNFNDEVYKSKDVWMIEFYAPWCGHCKKLQPEWEEAAIALKGQVKFAKVDATVEKGLAGRFGVSSYPTIKYWAYGDKKSDSKAIDYQGGRTAEDLKTFAQGLLEKADIEPTVNELISQDVFDSECTSGVCVITFLPNIYESSAKATNDYLKSIKTVAKGVISKPFSFFWLFAGQNIDLENNLGLGFGFPAVIAVSPQKKQFGIMKGAFSEKGLKDFINSLLVGKIALSSLPSNLKFNKVYAWDGKDAPVVEESHEDL